MTRALFRLCVFNGIGAALFAWAFMLGYVRQVFEGDVSHLSYVIAGLFLCTVIRTSWDTARSKPTAYMEDVSVWLVTLGLIGNIVGFLLALKGINVASFSDPAGAQKIAGHLLTGMSVAFYSTLVGAVTALWLSMSRRVIG